MILPARTLSHRDRGDMAMEDGVPIQTRSGRLMSMIL
jgi:hypothetical protein